MIALKIPIRIDSFYILTLLIPILFLLCGCRSSSGATEAKVPKPQTSCGWIYGEDTYNTCLARAKSGDANAAFNIAEAHKDGALYGNISGTNIKRDRTTAFYWYKAAADLGHEKALQKVFDGYHFGSYGPENKSEAERYLQHSARLGHQWAMLVLATQSEKQDPEKAMDLYLELARKDNCHAQRELAKIYFEGKLVPQDVCKSYFWALLAGAGAYSKYSDNHFLARNSVSSSGLCGSTVNEKYKAQKELGPEYVKLIQDAASKWQKGQVEPDFPKVQVAHKEEPNISDINRLILSMFQRQPIREKP
jgi:hypothetical protein